MPTSGGWSVRTGKLYGERVLLHPHEHDYEHEQPFTGSQAGIVVPQGVAEVVVRAHDKVHGFGGREITGDASRPLSRAGGDVTG